jgi:hypothetical protein
MDELKRQFANLLDKEESEQKYQEFLETYTQFIPREFVQNHGIHFRLVLRKLSLSKDYATDFFFLSKSSDDWNAVFIEIEKPYSKFFKNNSNDFHPDFLQAIQQINKWRAWLSQPENLEHFSRTTLGSLKQPLTYNPVYPKYVLVFGRRGEYEKNAIRRNLIRAQEREDFKIISYDSLLENTELNYELYVGIRKNEHCEIISDKYLSDNIFRYLEAEELRVKEVVKKQVVKEYSDKIDQLNRTDSTADKLYLKLEQPILDKVQSLKTID